QPHILDRDHSLVGKALDQRDLLRREGLDPRARKEQHADRRAFTQEWHPERSSIVAKFQHPLQMILGIILQIGHLSHASLYKSAADNRSASGRDGQALKVFSILTRLAPLARHRIGRRKLKPTATRPPDIDHFGTAKL